jgi:hypothetical protein
MKKLVATLSLAALATGVYAQGTIDIHNNTAQAFRTNTVAIGGAAGSATAASGGGNWYYEVLTAPSTVTTLDTSLQGLLTAPWSDTGVSGTNGALAGRMAGNANQVANFWPVASEQTFIVVGWSATEGTSWAAVAAHLAGAQLTGGQWGGGGLVAGGFLGASTLGIAYSGPASGPGQVLFNGTASASLPVPVAGTTDMYIVGGGVVPEPATLALAGLGAAALMIFRRRK